MKKNKLPLLLLTPFLLGSVFSCGAWAQAQSTTTATVTGTAAALPSAVSAPILVPNLTVNFKLNSTLGEKETAYYTKIVERILESLPKEITLTPEESNLLSGSGQYDTLKVIAYLPPSDEKIANNPLNKITKTFDIQFELPKERRLARLSREDETGRTFVEMEGSAEAFLTGEKAATETGDAPLNLNAVETAAATQVEIATPKTPEEVAEAAIKKPSSLSATQTQKLSLEYFDDSSAYASKDDAQFSKLVNSLKAKGKGKVHVVTSTLASPFYSWQSVRDKRIEALMEKLKNAGISLDNFEFSLIHVSSALRQNIQFEF